MTPLEAAIDPLAFDSWVQIAALMIIISGGVTLKWLSIVGAKQKETGDTVDEIKKTLTTNNGGSHIKDQLDRIEKVQAEQAKLMAADSQKLLDHIDWSTGYTKDTNSRIDGLSCQQRVGRHYLEEDKADETIG